MPRSLRSGTSRSLFLLVVAAMVIAAGCKPKAPPASTPPVEVEVVKVEQKDEPIVQEWIGTLDGMVNAEIRAEVTGYLMVQDYVDGQRVKKGDLLFEIDPRPFQAAYDQVQANFKKSELDFKRQAELIRTQAIAQQDYDNAVQAQLADKAALEQAELNLGFTKIRSPVDGIAGIAMGQIGDLVGPGTGVLTTVSKLDPIRVFFPVSERTYLDLFEERAGNPRALSEIKWRLLLADGSVYPRPGTYFAADREINANTGTMRMVATFPNPDYLLRPGEYGRVRAVVRVAKGALLVPQRAVSELQGAFQVATVDAGNRAHIITVTVADRVGSMWIIKTGLHPGDRVVAEGLQKVREGGAVNPQPYVPAPGENDAEQK